MMKQKINVLHVLQDYTLLAGGVPEVVRQLSVKGRFNDINSHVFATKGISSLKNVKICQESKFFSFWGWSKNQKKELSDSLSKINILHLHGVWNAASYFACKISKEKKIPFVFSSHGMLEPWLWMEQGRVNYYKKKLYWDYVIKNKLTEAELIHGITPLECDNLAQLFPKNKIVCIPNAVVFEDLEIDFFKKNRKNEILFLGRIEPKKGLHILLEAFSKSKLKSKWKLNIAGPVWNKTYNEKLINYVNSNNLSECVSFLGPVFGDEKERLLRNSWVMVTPSFSEAVGLVNLEGAARGLPSITTHDTGLYNWEEGGGKLINPEPSELKQILESVCSWTSEERFERGLASYNLARKFYSWDAVIPQWESLYLQLNVKGKL